MLTIETFDNIENKHTLYCGEDHMTKFCTSLREHATNAIKFENKENTINKKELKLHQNATECYICGKILLKEFGNDKNYWRFRDHCHFTGKYKDAACNVRGAAYAT